MADIFLVRHGQASFGAAVYDRLSVIGETQSTLLGRWLNQCGASADAVATGGLCRQTATAALCLAETAGPPVDRWLRVDGLAKYDHQEVVERFRPAFADTAVMRAELAKAGDARRAFQTIYRAAVERWVSGRHDGEYRESWAAFRSRVLEGLRSLAAIDARSIWAFTSGGPITAIVQELLGVPDAAAFGLNWPLVNSGVTRLRYSARSGTVSLTTLNAYPHLDQARTPHLITYR